jgi:hypothetical protein
MKKRRKTRKSNPSPAPRRRRYYRAAKRTAKRAGGRMIAGLNIRSAIKNALCLNVGMFAAKAAAKRFGLESSETSPESWTWRSYIQAAGGGFGAAFLMNAVKPGTGQRVLEGAIAFTLYKLIQNELVVKNPTAQSWFGADDEADPNLLPLDLEGVDDDVEEQLVYVDDQTGEEIPMSDEYRMQGLGSVTMPVDRLGEAMAPPSNLGRVDDSRQRALDAYRAHWA